MPVQQAAEHVRRTFGFWKTTLIGGVIFLLPLIVIGWLVGQIVSIAWPVAQTIQETLGLHSAAGYALLIGLTLAVIVLACFLAGLLARRRFAQRIAGFVEKNLSLMFPRYLIVKELMAGSIGGTENKPQLKAVAVQTPLGRRVGFEVERSAEGQVTVYLPGSPDPWAGSVTLVDAEQVERLDVEFVDALTTCEQLGRGTAELLLGHDRSVERS
ncbi:MAG: DUF502 domain-containing protein [Planctomycetota bacterium]